jgi:hypothetical protein
LSQKDNHQCKAILLYDAILGSVAKIFCKSELIISTIMLSFNSSVRLKVGLEHITIV